MRLFITRESRSYEDGDDFSNCDIKTWSRRGTVHVNRLNLEHESFLF